MSMIYLVGILVIIGGLVLLAYDNNPNVLDQSHKEARTLLATFGDESIAFDLEPQAPKTEFVYIEVEKEVEVVADDGTITTENQTSLEKVPTSEIYGEISDRQTGNTKIVKRGHQSDITGTIILLDPVTQTRIPPPYSYQLTLDCDFREWCNTNPIGINSNTDGEGKFKYTWTTTSKDSLGEYKIFVRITSQALDSNGNRQVLEHFMNLELVL